MSTATNTSTPEKTKTGLVDMVGRFIADESLNPGDRLPSIRDLAAQFDVKAGAVHDALLDAQRKVKKATREMRKR